MLNEIPAAPGTYLLAFQSDSSGSIQVGRKGRCELVPGYYFYIGSAFGPGGLRARLKHHYNISQRPHWHLDYLRPHLTLEKIWYSLDLQRYEHAWAKNMIYTMQLEIPMPGFGASDCHCDSHFFYSVDLANDSVMKSALRLKKQKITLETITI